MIERLRERLALLETVRESRVILYHLQGQKQAPKAMEDADVLPLYQVLRQMGSTERLDLVLYASGGSIVIAHRIAQLLRAHASQFNILVPYKARSSATLLCLAADEIVMGPLGELSPLDPHLSAPGDGVPGLPLMISSEDVRAFKVMAQEWFGINGAGDEMSLLRMVAKRIFPTSLSGFFRADQQMRQVAAESLGYQLPDTDVSQREHIIDQLVAGYHGHDYCISREEAARIGLRVRPASRHEDEALWSLWQTCSDALNSRCIPNDGSSSQVLNGLIASTDVQFHHVAGWVALPSAGEVPGSGGGHEKQTRIQLDGSWQRVPSV